MLLVMIVSLVIASLWNTIPFIKDTIHLILNPTAGALLNWNTDIGMIIVTLIIILLITLVQKFTIDAETMAEIKKEQKFLKEEMKTYKEHPEKMMELQKKQLEMIPRTFEITMKPLIYTAIPIILFFRWFNDYFTAVDVKIFGFFSWFWAYLLLSIIFSLILRKILKLP